MTTGCGGLSIRWIVVVLAMLGCGKIPQCRAQRTASLKLRVLGADIQMDDADRVVGVSFPDSTLDEELAVLAELEHLETLHLRCPKLTDRGLAHLRKLPKLRVLNLSSSGISELGLRHVVAKESLASLYLDDTGVGDAVLAQIVKLPHLRVLSLNQTAVTDRGLKYLEQAAKLTVLNLRQTNVSADAVLRLRQTLERLDVDVDCGQSPLAVDHLGTLEADLTFVGEDVTHVTLASQAALDRGLTYLFGLPHVQGITLVGVVLDDAHWNVLRRLPDLRDLNLLVHRKIARATIQRFKESQPAIRLDAKFVTRSMDESTVSSSESHEVLLRHEDATEPLRCSYYASDRGRAAAPVLILPDSGRNLDDYRDLATGLYNRGFAVILADIWSPDEVVQILDSANGKSNIGVLLLQRAIKDRLNAVGPYLQQLHAKGECNIDLLCLVADGVSAWATYDPGQIRGVSPREPQWNLAGAVLLSPGTDRFDEPPRYVSRSIELATPKGALILVGANRPLRLRMALSLPSTIRSLPPNARAVAPTDPLNPTDANANQIVKLPTDKQGIDLLGEGEMNLHTVASYLEQRVQSRREIFPWELRLSDGLESAVDSP